MSLKVIIYLIHLITLANGGHDDSHNNCGSTWSQFNAKASNQHTLEYANVAGGQYQNLSGSSFLTWFGGNGHFDYDSETHKWYDYCRPTTCTINIVDSYNSNCAAMAGISSDCSNLLILDNQNGNYTGY